MDSLFIYVVLATLVGARLGHVIFYQPELFSQDILSVFLPFRTVPDFEFTGFQGLASHGAAIGIIIAMFLYSKKVIKKPMLWVLDRIVIAVASGAVFVRIGNFINSEIIGIASGDFSLGVKFVQDGISKYQAIKATGLKNTSDAYTAIVNNPEYTTLLEAVPYRHPAQLYESFGYIFVFLALWFLYWKTDKSKQMGFLLGTFFVLLWTVRFFVEFVKVAQVDDRSSWALNTGQWLSIPFILAGIYLIITSKNRPVTS
jgi:prolipoprotein diacylglyceryl transferase